MAKDGGPAFPVSIHEAEDRFPVTYSGMSLRDWFAGQAMAGRSEYFADTPDGRSYLGRAAEHCYQIADAMLAARLTPDSAVTEATRGGNDRG